MRGTTNTINQTIVHSFPLFPPPPVASYAGNDCTKPKAKKFVNHRRVAGNGREETEPVQRKENPAISPSLPHLCSRTPCFCGEKPKSV